MDDFMRIEYLIESNLCENILREEGNMNVDVSIFDNIKESLFNVINIFKQEIPDGTDNNVLVKHKQVLTSNATAIKNKFNNATEIVRNEFGQAATDAEKAGTMFFGWVRNMLGQLGESISKAFAPIFNAVTGAVRAAYKFVSSFFKSNEKLKYLKTQKFFGFPASSWLIWGAVAAFMIYALNKVVKVLKKRAKDKSGNGVLEGTQSIVLFEEDMLVNEGEELTEGVQEHIYKKAAESAEELENQTDGANNSSSFFWKLLRKFVTILLAIFSTFCLFKLYIKHGMINQVESLPENI